MKKNNSHFNILNIQTDTFIDTVNHDLKSPLASIKIHAELIEKGVGELKKPSLLNSVKKIEQKVDYLVNLINDYTDYLHHHYRFLPYNNTTHDFDRLLSDTVFKFTQSHGSYKLEINGKIGRKVVADKDRFQQAVTGFIFYLDKVSTLYKKIEINCKVENNKVVVNIIGITSSERYKKWFNPEDIESFADRDVKIWENLGIAPIMAMAIIETLGGKCIVCTENDKVIICFTLPCLSK